MARFLDNPSPKTLAMRKWRDKHPEHKQWKAEYDKAYYQKNAEKIKQRSADWYEKNGEEARKRDLERYHANKILKGKAKGDRVANWKGKNVGYHALHAWVYRWKGKPGKCELCGTINAKRYFWANKSRTYKRDLDDWIRLCGKCHFTYDEQHKRPRDYHGRLI